jgi:hypothetical protein
MKYSVFSSVVAALIGILSLALVKQSGPWIVAPMLFWIAPVLLLSVIPQKRMSDSESGTPDIQGARSVSITLVITLLVAIASSWVTYPWFYFNYWRPGEFGRNSWALIAYTGHAVLLVILLKRFPRYWKPALAAAILAPMILTYVTLLRSTNWGLAIYTDDHPSFLYRLWLIGQSFPRLENYVPQWCAGAVEMTPILTGAWIPGVLFLPVWVFTLPHQYYTPLFGILYLVLVPLLIAGSIRMLGGSRTAALCGAAVSVIPTREFTLWLLHFGTIGANFAMALSIPVSALLYRILFQKGGPWSAVALTVCILLMALWPLSPVMALPMAFAVLLHAKCLTRRSFGLLACVVICAGLPLLVYYRSVLIGGEIIGEVGKGVGLQTLTWDRLCQGFTLLRHHVVRGHPLLVFLGLAGGLTLLRNPLRTWTISILCFFVLLGGWADAMIPGHQLYRLGIPMVFAAIPPAILAVDKAIHLNRSLPTALLALLLAVFPASAWNSVFIYTRQGHEFYFPLPDSILELGGLIHREQTHPGRVLLTGGPGEEYGGGHLGYLTVLFEREMLGNAYAHNQNPNWQAGTPPAAVPEDPEFFRSFVDTFAAAILVAIQEDWREFLNAQPHHYEPVGEIVDGSTRYSVYRVVEPSGFFIEGSGHVQASPNRLVLELDGLHDRVRIRYRWAEGMIVEAPARIQPFETHDGVRLIEIEPAGLSNVTIRYRR